MGIARDDEGVTEVIGFVLSFALSAIFLLIAMSVFYNARDNTDAMIEGVELKSIANQVAARVVEAGLVGQEFPNATMNIALDVPKAVNGLPYTIRIDNDAVRVSADDGSATATATTFRLDAVSGIVVGGTVRSSSERVIIVYEQTGPVGARVKQISIHEA